ncbi:hypothetical protein CEXT_106401 [Caerostris extrusa]|uniref:Uncharacterized protein n=1 Tax=Caerostris extrusa TaxID=172846 RepID=A0AAV4VMY1_CAEEX|nr:hypothetical protein CEXT_106401 [Caerostris extrusa]
MEEYCRTTMLVRGCIDLLKANILSDYRRSSNMARCHLQPPLQQSIPFGRVYLLEPTPVTAWLPCISVSTFIILDNIFNRVERLLLDLSVSYYRIMCGTASCFRELHKSNGKVPPIRFETLHPLYELHVVFQLVT